MISLMIASENLDYQRKIGKLSQPMKILINQLGQEEEQSKFGRAELRRGGGAPNNAIRGAGNDSIVSDDMSENLDDDNEELNTEDLGLVKYVSSNLKWCYKVAKVNMLSFAFHASLLVFIREVSRKQR